MSDVRRALVAIAGAAATLALAASASGFTVVEQKTAQGGDRFQVSCGTTDSQSLALPASAQNVRVLEPVAGQVVLDGFGRDELARIESVTLRTEGDRPVVDVTAVGTGRTCDGRNLAWDTNVVEIRASYEEVSHPKVLVSDEFGALDAKQRPRKLSATADAGWRKLRWQSWGGPKAVAKGVFWAERWIPVGRTDVVERTFTYRVRVTLSKIKGCRGAYHYTKLTNRFRSGAPKEVRRLAKPPDGASCLSG